MQDYCVSFSGGDPCEFVRGYEEFFKVNPMTEIDMIQYVMQDFEGEALEWYYEYVEENFLDTWTPDCWGDFVAEIYRKFRGFKVEHQVFVESPETKSVEHSNSTLVHNLFAEMLAQTTVTDQILEPKTLVISEINRDFKCLLTMVEYVNFHQVLRYDFDRWNYWLSIGLNFGFDPGDLSQLNKFLRLNSYDLTNILQTEFVHSNGSLGSCGINFLNDYCLWDGPIAKEEVLAVRLTTRQDDGRPFRRLTNFIFHDSDGIQQPFELLEVDGVFIFSLILPLDESYRKEKEQSIRCEGFGCMKTWAISGYEDGVPTIWVSTDIANYDCVKCSASYKKLFEHFSVKASACIEVYKKLSKSSGGNHDLSIDELLAWVVRAMSGMKCFSGGISIKDFLISQGEFINNQLVGLDDTSKKTDQPGFHWTKKEKINNDGRFLMTDATGSELYKDPCPRHNISADCHKDSFGRMKSCCLSVDVSILKFLFLSFFYYIFIGPVKFNFFSWQLILSQKSSPMSVVAPPFSFHLLRRLQIHKTPKTPNTLFVPRSSLSLSPQTDYSCFTLTPQLSLPEQINSHCQSKNLAEALKLLQQEPKNVKLDSAERAEATGILLQASGQQKDIDIGRIVHEMVWESPRFKNDFVLNTRIITMYSNCGFPSDSRFVFDQLEIKNLYQWNALVSGFTRSELWFDAVLVFCKLLLVSEYKPDNFTFPCVIKACGRILDLGLGQNVHGLGLKMGLGSDVFVGNALITMYGKCGLVEEAIKVFEYMPEKNLVSWNSMISVFSENGVVQESFSLFMEMLGSEECLIPDDATLVTVLPVCAAEGEVEMGRLIHGLSVKLELNKELRVNNALVDMYSKCGYLFEAQILFAKNDSRNVDSWNSIIAGYSRDGDVRKTFEILQEMQMDNDTTKVNEVTILNVIQVCSEKSELLSVKVEDYRPNDGDGNIRYKKKSKFQKQTEFEQLMVTKKQMEIDTSLAIKENVDTVLKETRLIDFKRQSKIKKDLDENITKSSDGISKGTTSVGNVKPSSLMSKTSINAADEGLLGKAGNNRKLIMLDCGKKECYDENKDGDNTLYGRPLFEESSYKNNTASCKDALKSLGITDMLSCNSGVAHATLPATSDDNTTSKQTLGSKLSGNSEASSNQDSEDDKELLQDTKIGNTVSQVPPNASNQNVRAGLEIEDRVKDIQDLLRMIGNSSSAQISPPVLTEVTADPNLKMLVNIFGSLLFSWEKKIVQTMLSQASEKGEIRPEPTAILDKRMIKRSNKSVTIVLVQWLDGIPEGATYEEWSRISNEFPHFNPWGQGKFQGKGNCQDKNAEGVVQNTHIVVEGWD